MAGAGVALIETVMVSRFSWISQVQTRSGVPSLLLLSLLSFQAPEKSGLAGAGCWDFSRSALPAG
jgi:hypothetical protein